MPTTNSPEIIRFMEPPSNPAFIVSELLWRDNGQSLMRPAVVKGFLHLFLTCWSLFFSFLRTPMRSRRNLLSLARSFVLSRVPYSLGPVSLHHFSVAHQPSLRSLWTMMKYSISLQFRIQGGG